MRELNNDDMPVLKEKVSDSYELNHIIPSKSFVFIEKGEYLATLIVGNKTLPINNFLFIPWNVQAKMAIEYYRYACSIHKTYNLILFDDLTTRGELPSMYDAFINQIKDGDFVWARIRTERELNILNSLSSEYIRVTNQDYLTQRGVNLSNIKSSYTINANT